MTKRNSDNIRAKIELERRQIERDIAEADAIAHVRAVKGNFKYGPLLDPDFDNLDVIGSLAT